ncbi:hypothetical protein LCGC14_1704710 [marine sediment metagenome]|uniref:Rho termination factor N-terminal domain-containing protein n=1 Tax=marine sediment metagenome TaxID=412755 RepID=A0A0F9JXG8_9ZZZZ
MRSFTELAQRAVLFLIGLVGICVSGVWFLQGGRYGAIVAFCGAMAALLADFFWMSKKSELSRSAIPDQPVYELKALARDMGLKGFSSLPKEELVALIRRRLDPLSRRWGVFKWIAVIAAFGAIPGLDWLMPPPSRVPPQYAIAWYERTEGKLRLIPPHDVEVAVSTDDILGDRVRIPIHLALRNLDAVPLEIVRVELSYDADLQISSSGKAKIDPSDRRPVYEHPIGTLENTEHYTPLEPVDTITIPTQFLCFAAPSRQDHQLLH